MSVFDLHCHSNCSDGVLSPEQLVERAANAGVTHLALTDHDSIAGLTRAQAHAASVGIDCISGIEFSCVWARRGIHVVGLHFDASNPALLQATEYMGKQRQARAQEIARQLAKVGLHGTLAGAEALAGGAQVGRPHFAQHLVDVGAVKNIAQAFKRYLGAGKIGDVKQQWPEIEVVVEWINQAGGTAVVAHPLKYQLTRTKLLQLCQDFQAAGGRGIEVISGADQKPQQTKDMVKICQKTQLQGSVGSDFHAPDVPWQALGSSGQLPAGVEPVWADWAVVVGD
ncbi:PHP domain-containing protein [Halioxenophilus aromaticivorans]|uniref:PHP domain-containing protein n=1 Tax=Halioxenophilus aromaticivorans TaxID=1306992 RepID=A0AAV3TVW3_9ALTE